MAGVYRVNHYALFRYDEKIEDPGETVYLGCVLLHELPGGVPVLARGHWHREQDCRAGAEFGRIIEAGAHLKGFDDNNVQRLDLYVEPEGESE